MNMENHTRRRRGRRTQKSWVEVLCFACSCLQISWRRLVLRKWLNVAAVDSDYSADTDRDSDSDPEICVLPGEQRFGYRRLDAVQVDADNDSVPKHRRSKSETFRAQYIKTKEIRICAATWNVAGRVPPDELCLDDWLDIDDPADIYVIGLQEVIPLNAGNVFGAEDTQPTFKWERLIRKSLGRIPPVAEFKCFSDPPSPSGFMPSENTLDIEDDIVLESGSDSDGPVIEDNVPVISKENLESRRATGENLDKSCLTWTEQSPHLLDLLGSETPTSLKCSKAFEGLSPLKTRYESLPEEKRRPHGYVRIVSKKMVGIFITIWVHTHLRRHIKNLRVSTVGVGIMGYIGNKGSIAVSMAIHQTPFCFICSHLTSGEKDADAVKRNADVLEIHRRTCFNSLPTTIYDHEKIIWLGDLNYRINLPYEVAKDVISKRDWSKLLEWDQLKKELEEGCVFHGWHEGTLSFPPTYKYDFDSEDYHQGDANAARRTPAWCDRVLTYGTGIKLLRYTRSEHKLSDHRPVSASYTVEVEVPSRRKLQRALSFTNAETEEEKTFF